MCELAAFEHHTLAITRTDILQRTVVVYAELAAVAFLPACIQVNDHRILAASVIPKLIKVFFIKAPGFIHRIMKLVPCDAGVAGTVQVAHKKIHLVKEIILVRVVMLAVEPVNPVTSHGFVMNEVLIIAYSGWQQQVRRV